MEKEENAVFYAVKLLFHQYLILFVHLFNIMGNSFHKISKTLHHKTWI